MRSSHRSYYPGGPLDLEAARRCNIERACCYAANYLGCVHCGKERRFGNADDRHTDRVCGICPEPRTTLGIEGGVSINDQELKEWAQCQDRSDARQFPLVKRAWFVWRRSGDVNNVLGYYCRELEVPADD
jgi:hypothetical protein